MSREDGYAEYLHDGIYAKFDGHRVILLTGSHRETEAGNVIVMEDYSVHAFKRYLESLNAKLIEDAKK